MSNQKKKIIATICVGALVALALIVCVLGRSCVPAPLGVEGVAGGAGVAPVISPDGKKIDMQKNDEKASGTVDADSSSSVTGSGALSVVGDKPAQGGNVPNASAPGGQSGPSSDPDKMGNSAPIHSGASGDDGNADDAGASDTSAGTGDSSDSEQPGQSGEFDRPNQPSENTSKQPDAPSNPDAPGDSDASNDSEEGGSDGDGLDDDPGDPEGQIDGGHTPQPSVKDPNETLLVPAR